MLEGGTRVRMSRLLTPPPPPVFLIQVSRTTDDCKWNVGEHSQRRVKHKVVVISLSSMLSMIIPGDLSIQTTENSKDLKYVYDRN